MSLFHHEQPKSVAGNDLVDGAERFFINATHPDKKSHAPLLAAYYNLSLGYIGDVADALEDPNPLKNKLYAPLAYLYSEIGLLMLNTQKAHSDLLQNPTIKSLNPTPEEMAKHVAVKLLKIKKLHMDRLNKVGGGLDPTALHSITSEVHKKESILDGWWGKAYVQEKEPETIERIWDAKGKMEVRLSNNCAPISLELLQTIKKVYSQPTYQIMQGENNRKIEIPTDNKDITNMFAKYYIADKFLDYSAFLFENKFMVEQVLAKFW